MLTMRTIMSQVQGETGLSPSTWRMRIFTSRSFKTQEIPSVRLWREGLPIQGSALRPGFGPRTFTKCMDAALAPLRLQGIRVLNYLDDWLILAHSRELVSRHRDIVLGHIHSLGLRMNAKKSVLLPSQRTVSRSSFGFRSDAGPFGPGYQFLQHVWPASS